MRRVIKYWSEEVRAARGPVCTLERRGSARRRARKPTPKARGGVLRNGNLSEESLAARVESFMQLKFTI